MRSPNLQKISSIFLPDKQLSSSPKKVLVPFTNSVKDLSDETVKTKLDACLYGLKSINDKLKKGEYQNDSNPLTTKLENMSSLGRNLTKNLQNSALPKITNDEQRKKLLSQKLIMQQKLIYQNSYTVSSSEIMNSSILKDRSNHSSFSVTKQQQSMNANVSRSILPKMINQKLKQLSSLPSNSSGNLNISFKKKFDTSFTKNLQPARKAQFPPKIKKHLYEPAEGKALSKQNRYFPTSIPSIDPKQIQRIGLYQSSNRYRKEFITKEMGSLSPKINKKELELAKVCKQNQLFLTRPKQLEPMELDEFLKGEFLISEAKPKRYFETIQTEDIENLTAQNAQNEEIPVRSEGKKTTRIIRNQTQNEEDHIAEERTQEADQRNKNLTFFQIKNFEIVKNSSYIKFRVANIEIWQEIENLLSHIVAFVKELKISSCKFKANNLLEYWSGKRLSKQDIQKILKINKDEVVGRQKSAIQSLLSILHAKRKMKSIILAKTKKLSYMRWVSDRIRGIRNIRKQTEYKMKKAHQIHEKLLQGDYTWDTQIYISSFSENPFVRNTTQYMQAFENMFTHMWKQSSKHMILVVPTVNSEILQLYQEKLKIKRSITLICPEVHDLFPVNMSLAGCLLFSYEALNKIKQLIEGKNAVIIPGKWSSPKYQLLISQFLRTPLMTSLKPRTDLQFQKELFSSASLSVLPYISIKPQASFEEIIKQFARLLISHKQINKWILKINGQFGGRGLATFCIRSSKTLKSILNSGKDMLKSLQEQLKKILKLKLKINFENSLFMLGDYLQRLAQKGGIIEQQKEQIDSYEVSFFIQSKLSSQIVSCFKCFTVCYSNKSFIYEAHPNAKLATVLSSLKNTLQVNEYLGYVSVNLVIAGDKVYGIQVKPYLTHLSSVEPFIRAIESKRQLKLNLNVGQAHEKMENELISSTLRNQFIQKSKNLSRLQNITSLREPLHNVAKLNTQNSHLLSHINLSTTELQTFRPNINDFTYLFIPNIILTDVPIPKKAEFIESLITEAFQRPKFDILSNNLILYLSNGLSLSLLIVGKEMKRIKKTAIEVVRFLSEKSGSLKIYCGKNQARDVFQFGDIIKAVAQMKG